MEHIVIAITVTGAAIYLGYRIFMAMKNAGDPCRGCDGCALSQKSRQAHNRKRRKPTNCPK